MDKISRARRSDNMRRIGSKDTGPEQWLRSYLHKEGYRFRLHRKDLPGRPDIVMPKHGIVIFVNGCFWHQHERCKQASWPKTNTDYWHKKLQQNVERDQENYRVLAQKGWKVVVIWECELKGDGAERVIRERIVPFGERRRGPGHES